MQIAWPVIAVQLPVVGCPVENVAQLGVASFAVLFLLLLWVTSLLRLFFWVLILQVLPH